MAEEVPEHDLLIEVYNKRPENGLYVGMDTAVRVTHLPTGTTAESSGERSQLANKAAAIATLREKLLSGHG